MSEQKHVKGAAVVYLWVAPPPMLEGKVMPDKAPVLGIGLSARSAYDNAQRRHGEGVRGYAVRMTLDAFPADANPVPSVCAALWASHPSTVEQKTENVAPIDKKVRGA